MNRIKEAFAKKKRLLNIYFTAGYPDLDTTASLIKALVDSGADIIEIGMPYSDPMADGPTIQMTSSVALLNGLTLKRLFDQVELVRSYTDCPLLFMGYLNQLMQYGEEAFLKKCQEIGVDGLIIPDLPPELYDKEYRELFEKYGVNIVFLITPQTSEERIRRIDELTNSFIYIVSRSSITGAKSGISEDQKAYFERIRQMNLSNHTMIGFGISDRESFDIASSYADGAIIGSAFLKHLSDYRKEQDLAAHVDEFVKKII